MAFATAARAEPPRDFCADRPGKGSPPCVLDVGRLQAELAAFDLAFQRSGPGSSDTYALGGVELRLGLTPMMEGQVSWTPYTQVRARSDGVTQRTEGVGDLTLGLRRSLRNPGGDGFSVALEPYVTAPTATSGMGAGGWEGGLAVPMAVPLGGDRSLSLTPRVALARDGDGSGQHLVWSGAVGMSRSYGPLTVDLELWGQVDDDPGGVRRQASIDVSLAWIPRSAPDLQFDIGLYGGLTDETPDLEVAAGVARRF